MKNQNIRSNIYYFFVQKGKTLILLIASLIVKRNIIITKRRCITFMGLYTPAFCPIILTALIIEAQLGKITVQTLMKSLDSLKKKTTIFLQVSLAHFSTQLIFEILITFLGLLVKVWEF